MKFINYTNDGRVVVQHAALILSKLDETDTLELHTMDNAIILLKKDMTLVETRDVLQGMVRLARSMTLDALCNSDAEDKTPLVDESVDDEYEDTITIPVPLEAFGDAGLLGKDLHIQVIDGAVVITEDTMMSKDHEYLYPYSAQEARTRNQLPMWRESYHANVACRNAIEETIRQNFDGMHLKKDCLEPVLAEYGYKRTEWVLATTLQELSWDGRFSRANKQWAARRYIPQDERHNAEITVRSHPAILDAFVDLYREAYQKLGLFGPEHCVGDRAEQDYIGKVLVLSPDTLKESCWSQENQLWYAHDGFGCSPHAIGRSVRCTCLSDGEMTRWNRDEFVGVLDEKFLPDWAKESLSQFQQEEAAESPGMNNQSM